MQWRLRLLTRQKNEVAGGGGVASAATSHAARILMACVCVDFGCRASTGVHASQGVCWWTAPPPRGAADACMARAGPQHALLALPCAPRREWDGGQRRRHLRQAGLEGMLSASTAIAFERRRQQRQRPGMPLE
mmetsp:Transcript_7657/g.23046  ORF Transcript_7657/g.23046 Transcript_7657/m.23046 type:complete len:133 (-) Transcript_7657:314-712(-)